MAAYRTQRFDQLVDQLKEQDTAEKILPPVDDKYILPEGSVLVSIEKGSELILGDSPTKYENIVLTVKEISKDRVIVEVHEPPARAEVRAKGRTRGATQRLKSSALKASVSKRAEIRDSGIHQPTTYSADLFGSVARGEVGRIVRTIEQDGESGIVRIMNQLAVLGGAALSRLAEQKAFAGEAATLTPEARKLLQEPEALMALATDKITPPHSPLSHFEGERGGPRLPAGRVRGWIHW